jgi:hypothetical protein
MWLGCSRGERPEGPSQARQRVTNVMSEQSKLGMLFANRLSGP